MKRVLAVIGKELKRFFTDFRMLMALILPGVAIFIIYSIMGEFLSSDNITKINKEYEYNIALSNNYNLEQSSDIPSTLQIVIDSVLTKQGYTQPKFLEYDIDNKDDQLSLLKDKKIDILICFDDNFEKNIIDKNFEVKPNLNIFYNSESKESEILYSMIKEIVSITYSSYTLNASNDSPNVGETSSMMNQIMGIVLPMVTISLLYSTTLTVCPESIAGEKERGTLSSILISPIKRSQFALGKVIALCLVSLFGGVISGVGILSSLPKMMSVNAQVNIGIDGYVMLFFITITLVLLFVNIAICFSTFAKTPKEASGYLAPMIAVFMFLGMMPAITNCSNIVFAFVPILNASQAIYAIVNQTTDILFMILTLVSNVVYSALLIVLDVKLFNTESIIMRQ